MIDVAFLVYGYFYTTTLSLG